MLWNAPGPPSPMSRRFSFKNNTRGYGTYSLRLESKQDRPHFQEIKQRKSLRIETIRNRRALFLFATGKGTK